MAIGKWVKRYEVASMTDPGKTYAVSLSDRGIWACGCPVWRFSRAKETTECKHIQFVKANQAAKSKSIPGSTTASTASLVMALRAAEKTLKHWSHKFNGEDRDVLALIQSALRSQPVQTEQFGFKITRMITLED